MKKFAIAVVILALNAAAWAGETRDKDVQRIQSAAEIIEAMMSAPDSGIPNDILDNAECVAVVPSMMKGAFILGAEYGKGVASCRTANGWSAPAFFQMSGGSFGFQIGGQAADLVLLIMDQKGMQRLLSSKFKLGADASAAAGPLGRHAEADTDWKMHAEVLSYSRNRGVFAGISLAGDEINQNKDDTRAFYWHMVTFHTILTGAVAAPPESKPFLDKLNLYAPTGRASTTRSAESKPQGSAPPASRPK